MACDRWTPQVFHQSTREISWEARRAQHPASLRRFHTLGFFSFPFYGALLGNTAEEILKVYFLDHHEISVPSVDAQGPLMLVLVGKLKHPRSRIPLGNYFFEVQKAKVTNTPPVISDWTQKKH